LRSHCGPANGRKRYPSPARAFSVNDDEFAGDQSIGEIDAEAAGKVVVTDSGRIDRACLGGYRTEPWPILKGDGDDPFDHLCHLWRGEPEIPMPPLAVHRKQPSFPRCVLAV
jgi:hypothetical protein